MNLDKVSNSTDQLKTATQLFGAEGSTLAIILANNRDKMAQLTEEYKNSAGIINLFNEMFFPLRQQ